VALAEREGETVDERDVEIDPVEESDSDEVSEPPILLVGVTEADSDTLEETDNEGVTEEEAGTRTNAAENSLVFAGTPTFCEVAVAVIEFPTTQDGLDGTMNEKVEGLVPPERKRPLPRNISPSAGSVVEQ